MIKQYRLTFGKGLNADALPSELGDGFVSDCNHVRFRDEFAERIGPTGTSKVEFSSFATLGALAALHTDDAVYIVGAGSSSFTAESWAVGGGSSSTVRTRRTEGVTISSMTAVGTTVTVTTSTTHLLSTGNTISVWGCIPSTYNAESVAITVTSGTTFTYTAASAPSTSPATSVGLYSVAGSSAWTSQLGTGGELNGVLFMNSPDDGLYYWSAGGADYFRKVARSYKARVARPFKNYIVLLAPTMSGTEYPYRIAWSDATEPGSVPATFVSAGTNEAGDVERPEIGEMIDAVPLGDDLIVYGSRGRLLMRYIGGNEVFSFTTLPGEDGLLNENCAVNTPVGHFFINANKQVMTHTGGACQNLSDGRVSTILASASTSGGSFLYAVNHPRLSEVWICYTTSNAAVPSSVLIYNWQHQTWGKTSINASRAGIAAGNGDKRLYFGSTNDLYEHDLEGAGGSNSYIERKGIDAGDADVVKNLQQSKWNWDTNTLFGGATFSIEHGSNMTADGTPTYAGSVSYTPGTTDYCNARATGGRYLSVKATWGDATASSAPAPFYNLRVRSAVLRFSLGGRR